MVQLHEETNTVTSRQFFSEFIPELVTYESFFKESLPDVFTYEYPETASSNVLVLGSDALSDTGIMKSLVHSLKLGINPTIYFIEQSGNLCPNDYVIPLRWISLELRSISLDALIEFSSCDIFYMRKAEETEVPTKGNLVVEYVSPSHLKELIKLDDLLKTHKRA